MLFRKNRKKESGFTLIEALIFLFVFTIITMTFYQVYVLGLKYIIDAKNRLGAIALANEKMEIIRNLPYYAVGTEGGGAVSGNLPYEENVTSNAGQYHVKTEITYADDPLDGVGSEDENNVTSDYKNVSIVVSWSNGQGQVILTSRFVPPAIETENPSIGTLSIYVHSDDGASISGSKVTIVDTQTNLEIGQGNTDNTGTITFMGDNMQEGSYRYEVMVEKLGYEKVVTRNPSPIYYPQYYHATVQAGVSNLKPIEQNRSSGLKIKSVDYLGDNSIGDIKFHIVGGRLIGHDPSASPNKEIYSMDEDGQTNSSGEKTYDAISPGPYRVTLDPSETDYVLIDTDPVTNQDVSQSPSYPLFAGMNQELKIKLAKKDIASLLVRVKTDEASSQPITGAKVTLKSVPPNFSAETNTTTTGTAFFPLDENALVPGTYDLKIMADGYLDEEKQVTIEENKLLQIEDITLSAS